jgi:hypothetical protein
MDGLTAETLIGQILGLVAADCDELEAKTL